MCFPIAMNFENPIRTWIVTNYSSYLVLNNYVYSTYVFIINSIKKSNMIQILQWLLRYVFFWITRYIDLSSDALHIYLILS